MILNSYFFTNKFTCIFQRLERTPFNPEEAEWETKKVIDDYKFKLQKAEQDISTCQTNVRFSDNVICKKMITVIIGIEVDLVLF